MAIARDTEPLALPLLAVMRQADAPIDAIMDAARARFGAVLENSPEYSFDAFTNYYAAEFGTGLVKQIIIFAEPREQRFLMEDKLWSNALEQTSAPGSEKRIINLDPGYLTLSKLILASTKDHAQRIYLGQGIWAEITLAWRGKSFERHPWSYPDYIARIPFLNRVREGMRARLTKDLIVRLR
ncbi:MAG: DUF4416 family protein [Spirochaetota bacterium]|jgi:hypothetical protein|nr:DUF4416 family protein [Spirochaetota bacterium]